jgi:SAM-dependent methyltransferase
MAERSTRRRRRAPDDSVESGTRSGETAPVDPFGPRTVRAAYDAVASEYADAFDLDLDLDDLPVDREVLDQAIQRLGEGGPVLDLGCGPAQVSRYLAARGVAAVGLDLAAAALAEARRRHGPFPLAAADLRALPVPPGSCAGAIAFYAIHHLRRAELPSALAHVRQALVPGGVLVLATHLGDGEVDSGAEWLGHRIEPVAGTLYRTGELEDIVAGRGFSVDDSRQRAPTPDEYPTHRVYVTARAEL